MNASDRDRRDSAGTAQACLGLLNTPRLLLDRDRLERNCARMRERCAALGVRLRPHLKTAKSLDVARVATGGDRSAGLTVSTLREAEHFAAGGYRDLLLAAAIVPNKLPRAARIGREHGAELLLVTDSLDTVQAAGRFAAEAGTALSFLIEIDCGERRGGLDRTDHGAVVGLAKAIQAGPGLRFVGVMTHAGHSYASNDPETLTRIAGEERDAAVGAAEAVRASGTPCPIVSVGSTPTALFADHLRGVTELRAGIYMVWDLAQASRRVCGEAELALSVLSAVIGHNRAGRSLLLDAGALALSKDVSAHAFRPEVGFGLLCDPAGERLGELAVTAVHQEHGTVALGEDAETWFRRLPVGTLVRVLPNHACITAAAYDSYDVLAGGELVDRWARVNGW